MTRHGASRGVTGAFLGRTLSALSRRLTPGGLPEIVKRFFSALVAEQPAYAFFVATYGTTPGFTGEQARRLLGERGLSLDALFSVRMPDNWTLTFDLSDPDKVAETNRKADKEIGRAHV